MLLGLIYVFQEKLVSMKGRQPRSSRHAGPAAVAARDTSNPGHAAHSKAFEQESNIMRALHFALRTRLRALGALAAP